MEKTVIDTNQNSLNTANQLVNKTKKLSQILPQNSFLRENSVVNKPITKLKLEPI